MRIGVIGAGVSGLVAAYLLSRGGHDVVVFEGNDYLGGHTRTIGVQENGSVHPVDTGFMVFNHRTYPNFTRILDRLGVECEPTKMSFSLQCERTRTEYNSHSIGRLFAQRRNLFKPSFHRMWMDILRFNRQARRLLADDGSMTISNWLSRSSFSEGFRDRYLKAICAAIWSARPDQIDRFPVRFLARFLNNHGLLSVNGQPRWRVVRGGAARYVQRLTQSFHGSIRLSSPVACVRRLADEVVVKVAGEEPERFDQVVMALHSDQALQALEDPTLREREILGSIGYQANDTVLHSDESLMPRSNRAWASWNHYLPVRPQPRVAITYHSNQLLNLKARNNYFVTLNRRDRIAEERVIRTMTYHHPIFSVEAVDAQKRHTEISGLHNRTHYCGAYWGYGFHEDGVKSALRVCREFGLEL